MAANTVDKTALFETLPVRRAVLSLAIPTVASQLVVLVYNMTDTWLVGQTGDTAQVAAVAASYPIFMMLNAIANVFGIGGGSLLSRLLGRGARKQADMVAGFMIWAAACSAGIYSIAVQMFSISLLALMGVHGPTAFYAERYLFWTVVVGGIPTVLNLTVAAIVRAQGESRLSSAGICVGALMNIILGPTLMFGFQMNIEGAAIATAVSNASSLVFLVQHMIRNRRTSMIHVQLYPCRMRKNEMMELFSIGIPAALVIIMASVSNSVMIRLMSGYTVTAVSGMGIMQKLDIIPFQVIMGVSDGALPLIAYNYAANNRTRMAEAVRFTIGIGFRLSLAFFVIFELAAPVLVRFFIDDPATVAYGTEFVRLRCIALPFITVEFMLIAVFQAVGGARQALVLSMFRKGIVDLPLMALMNLIWPMYGLMLVQPMMEFAGAAIALTMYRSFRRKTSEKIGEAALLQVA